MFRAATARVWTGTTCCATTPRWAVIGGERVTWPQCSPLIGPEPVRRGGARRPVRHPRHGQVRQLHVRPHRPDGQHRHQVRALPLPLRHRVQPDRGGHPPRHVVPHRQESSVGVYQFNEGLKLTLHFYLPWYSASSQCGSCLRSEPQHPTFYIPVPNCNLDFLLKVKTFPFYIPSISFCLSPRGYRW